MWIEATSEECIYEDPWDDIVRTDRNGTFSYVFTECETPPKLMSLRLRLVDSEEKDTALGAAVDVHGKRLGRLLDLGDIKLHEARLIVSGRITGRQAAKDILARYPKGQGPKPDEARFDALPVVQERYGKTWFPDDETWGRWDKMPDTDPQVLADDLELRLWKDGRFEIRGHVLPVPLRLALEWHAGFHRLARPIPFEAGAKGVVVKLQPGGRIRSMVRVPKMAEDDGFLHRFLEIHLVDDDAPAGTRVDLMEEPWRSQKFCWWPRPRGTRLTYDWSCVPPGRYRLEVRIDGIPKPVRVVRDLRIRDGELLADTRIADIDLRRDLRVVTLHVVDAKGQPISSRSGGGAIPVGDGVIERIRLLSETRGKIQVPVASEPRKVWLMLPGFEPRTLTITKADAAAPRRVVLQRGRKIQLRLVDKLTDLPAGVKVFATLTKLGLPSGLKHVPFYWRNGNDKTELVEDAGTFTLYASEPGTYCLDIRVRRDNDDEADDVTVEGSQPYVIRVRENAAPKTIGVLIPTKALWEAIRK